MTFSLLTLKATVTEGHQLIIDLPEDFPIGAVEVVVRSAVAPQETIAASPTSLTREQARALFLSKDMLMEMPMVSDFVPLSPEARESLAEKLSSGGSLQNWLDESRAD